MANAPQLLTIDDWHAAYAEGATPRALLEALRQRLEHARAPGVWITLADEAAIESQLGAIDECTASLADAAARRRAMPLYGVPFAVKDNIDVAGMVTTAACPAFARPADAHAHAIERLLAAGAVCIGKTNLDQFATGLVGTRSPYGRPSSTFAADRISGGSSSGSAVAVSSGVVPFALGTDTAGSGRVPAAFNNVVGLKPTPGRVSTRGVVPACRSIDCVSVFALTAADAARVLAVVEGADEDSYSRFEVGPARFADRVRVGVPADPVFFGDAGYAPAYAHALASLGELGLEIVAVEFGPLHALGARLYGGPWLAERYAVVEDLLARTPEAIDPTVRAVIAPAAGLSATDAFRGMYAVREAQRDAAAIWRDVDVLMVPSAPGHPRHADIDAEPVALNARLGAYATFVNLLGWCAMAMPASITAEGLPFGVTFIAPPAHDAALARLAMRWQEHVALPLGATAAARVAANGAEPHPMPASEATVAIAVVGAHLRGLPLHPQLLALGASFVAVTRTAPCYRLFALPGTSPPKPGMVRVVANGAAIEVEVWTLPSANVGVLLASIAAPLGLGSVELRDSNRVHGFLCEPHATADALDISAFGGWRSYLASLGHASPGSVSAASTG